MSAEAVAKIRSALGGLKPHVALVLGSGLGGLVDQVEDVVVIPYGDLPGFPQSSVSGHAGKLVGRTFRRQPGDHAGRPRALLRDMPMPPPCAPLLETLAGVGIDTLILTNAAGSLMTDMPAGSVMLIDRPHQSVRLEPAVRRTDRPTLRRHDRVPMTMPCGMRSKTAAGDAGIALHKGVYMWFSGPSFETPAEIRMARITGRRRRRHVDRAGGHSRPFPRPAGRRLLGHHQSRRRHDRRRTFASGDQGHGADRRRTSSQQILTRAIAQIAAARTGRTDAMLPQEIIRRKRDGQALVADEIAVFVDGMTDGAVSEGQVAAFAHGGLLQRHEPRRGRGADAGHARFRRRARLVRPRPARSSTSIRPAASATMSR